MNKQKIDDVLTFLRRSKALESTARYRSSLRGTQNTVAEHSWRLGLMALVIGSECNLALDMNRVLSLAIIHDLAEAQTGDLDAYDKIESGEAVAKDKAVQEASAVRAMTHDLSFGDWIYTLWNEYEMQTTLESKFVKALDRIEGFLHIAEGEVAAYVPEKFHGDYADEAVAAFDEAARNFPEIKDLLAVIKADLKTQFQAVGVTWVDR